MVVAHDSLSSARSAASSEGETAPVDSATWRETNHVSLFGDGGKKSNDTTEQAGERGANADGDGVGAARRTGTDKITPHVVLWHPF